jgi:Spy/CpxP family protein refolding chaperone
MKRTNLLVIAIAAALQSATLLAQGPSGTPGMDDRKHREMMPMHAKMIEIQKVQDSQIDKLLAEMNAATGESAWTRS